MSDRSFTLDVKQPGALSPEALERLDGLTEAQVQAAAEADADNPPLTPSELARVGAARAAQRARACSGLTQARFAERFGIKLGRLRDLEQGRAREPDAVLVAYLRLIERDPDLVAGVLAEG